MKPLRLLAQALAQKAASLLVTRKPPVPATLEPRPGLPTEEAEARPPLPSPTPKRRKIPPQRKRPLLPPRR